MALVGTINAPNDFGFKNRIINGAMVIDQRNAGVSIAVAGYPVDRTSIELSGTGGLTSQRSTDAPAGFTNSLLTTVTTIDSSIGAAEYYQIVHHIEGFNVADLNLGTANASAFMVSFWVKASQTGTYSVHLANSTGNRCYPTTITVNASATWEYKTISVPATTAGTFNTTNGQGLSIRIGIVYGSNFNGATTNAWANFTGFANSFATTTNNMMATLNATLQITGLQLEKGSTATSFDYRSYGTELALCQRYFETNQGPGWQVGTSTGSLTGEYYNNNAAGMNTYFSIPIKFAVYKRASPSVTLYSPNTGTINKIQTNYSTNLDANSVVSTAFPGGFSGGMGASPGGAPSLIAFNWTAATEL